MNNIIFDESLEEWRHIKWYEVLYQVSSNGRVRSVDRVVTYSDGLKVPYHGAFFFKT